MDITRANGGWMVVPTRVVREILREQTCPVEGRTGVDTEAAAFYFIVGAVVYHLGSVVPIDIRDIILLTEIDHEARREKPGTAAYPPIGDRGVCRCRCGEATLFVEQIEETSPVVANTEFISHHVFGNRNMYARGLTARSEGEPIEVPSAGRRGDAQRLRTSVE